MTNLGQSSTIELPSLGATLGLAGMRTEYAGTYQNRCLLDTLFPLAFVGRLAPRCKLPPQCTIVLGVHIVEDQTKVLSIYILMQTADTIKIHVSHNLISFF